MTEAFDAILWSVKLKGYLHVRFVEGKIFTLPFLFKFQVFEQS